MFLGEVAEPLERLDTLRGIEENLPIGRNILAAEAPEETGEEIAAGLRSRRGRDVVAPGLLGGFGNLEAVLDDLVERLGGLLRIQAGGRVTLLVVDKRQHAAVHGHRVELVSLRQRLSDGGRKSYVPILGSH